MLDALSDEPLSDSPWAPISDGEKMIFTLLAGEAKPLIVTVQLDTPKPTVTVPPESPLTVEDNRILLEDGRELMIQFAG